jgi:hypothetical protein
LTPCLPSFDVRICGHIHARLIYLFGLFGSVVKSVLHLITLGGVELLPLARCRPPRQIGNLLHQVDLAYDQPRLSVVVDFAGPVRDPHIARHVELRFILVGDADVIGGPGDARRKIPDLDGNLAGDLAFDVPLEGIVATGREGRVHQIDLILLVEDAELNAGRINQGVRPGELDAVDAFLDREQAMLANHRDVLGVVDRELRAFSRRESDQIDGGPGWSR